MTAAQSVRIGHTPDADDAFMFYGFASGRVSLPGIAIVHELHDIQALNVRAQGPDPFEVTALSLATFFRVEHRYELLPVGSSVGRGYGPKLVARHPMQVESMAGKAIAMPGSLTTATLLARTLLPKMREVHVPFTNVIETVLSGRVDAGILIHEGQLTYREYGLHEIADLGEAFTLRFGLPVPLGVNCVRRDLPEGERAKICTGYIQSVKCALEDRQAALEYCQRHARGADPRVIDRFVGMYVNGDSLGLSADVSRAIEVLKREFRSQEMGLGVGA